jgi:hypothetical protein
MSHACVLEFHSGCTPLQQVCTSAGPTFSPFSPHLTMPKNSLRAGGVAQWQSVFLHEALSSTFSTAKKPPKNKEQNKKKPLSPDDPRLYAQ